MHQRYPQLLACLHCRGGVTIGGLAAVFYTTQILSSIARARKDHRDVMAAGLATGAAAGLFSERRLLRLAACKCAVHTPPVDKPMCSSVLTVLGSASSAAVITCSAGQAWCALAKRSAWGQHRLPGAHFCQRMALAGWSWNKTYA